MWPTLLRTAAGRLLKNRLGVLRRSSESPLSLLILRAHRDRSRSITGHHPHLSLAFSPGFLSLFTHLSQQLVERAIGENPTELRVKITDETDVIDHYVVDFPIVCHEVETIADGKRITFAHHDPSVDLGKVLIHPLTKIDNLFASIGLQRSHVGVCDKISKGGNKLYLSAIQILPVAAKGLLGHFREIEARQKYRADRLSGLNFRSARIGARCLDPLHRILDLRHGLFGKRNRGMCQGENRQRQENPCEEFLICNHHRSKSNEAGNDFLLYFGPIGMTQQLPQPTIEIRFDLE